MSILDTFSIVFTSNAKDVKKDVGEAEKATKEFGTSINDVDKSVGALGAKLIQIGASGIAAFATFEGLKGGITNAINFNAELEKTHILTGMSAHQLALYDATFAQFGANSGDFTSWLQNASRQVQLAGGDVANIVPNLRLLSKELSSMSEKDALQRFRIAQGAFNIPESFFLALRQGPEAFDNIAREQERVIAANDKIASQGLELQSAFKGFESAVISVFSRIIPYVTIFIKGWSDLLSGKAFNKDYNINDLFKENLPSPPVTAKEKPSGSSAETNSNKDAVRRESYQFWTSKGYTPAQASGLVANEERESGFNPHAVGDHGQAMGPFQHHADRRELIKQGTGIDIATASHLDQLKAAEWELNQRGDSDRLKNTQTPQEAAAVVTKYFERPANAGIESIVRGNIAARYYEGFLREAKQGINAADTSPLNTPVPSSPAATGSSQSITIGTLSIQSQTDNPQAFAKQFKECLNTELAYLNANRNDGVKA